MLSPLEIQDLELPHAFGIPIVSISPCLRNSSSKNPPCLRFPKSRPWYGTDIFWNRQLALCCFDISQLLLFIWYILWGVQLTTVKTQSTVCWIQVSLLQILSPQVLTSSLTPLFLVATSSFVILSQEDLTQAFSKALGD